MLGGALLVFIGVALFSSRLVRPLAAVANPVARWSVVIFSILVWPFFTLPYWLLRYGAWGPGCDRTAGRCVRPRCGAEPVDTADRPR